MQRVSISAELRVETDHAKFSVKCKGRVLVSQELEYDGSGVVPRTEDY